ncbi:MAG: hypothetical protein ACKVZ0_24850 [Gemmatimonadales bacterium]
MPPITSFQGLLDLLDNNNQVTIRLWGTQGTAVFGGNDTFGGVILRDGDGEDRLRAEVGGITGSVAGVKTFQLRNLGDLRLLKGGEPTAVLSGGLATLTLGDHGLGGEVYLRAPDGTTRVRLNGYTGTISLYDESGDLKATLGPEGTRTKHWTLRLRDEDGQTLAVLGKNGNLTLGGGDPKNTGHDGDIVLRDQSGRERIHLDGGAGAITLKNAKGSSTVKIDGEAGDLLLFNADCAEEFEAEEDVEAGSVVVSTGGSHLARACRAYDRRVVGVVSGGGGFRPGIVLGHRASSRRRIPVAVLGRVGCRADAGYGAIEVGDLLTTSETAGYAMRVADFTSAQGAVLGKALSPLARGRGLVEALVALG